MADILRGKQFLLYNDLDLQILDIYKFGYSIISIIVLYLRLHLWKIRKLICLYACWTDLKNLPG